MTDFMNPKALLVATDDTERPWVVLETKQASQTVAAKGTRTAKRVVTIAAFLLVAGLLLPGAFYGVLRERAAAALLDTANGGAALPTFELPPEPQAPAPGLEGSLGAIGTTTYRPAVSAASNNAVVRIAHVGIEIPVVEGAGESALFRGAWRSPYGAAPDQGGNTVIFGHRFLKLPPAKDTFFRLDQVAVGDTFEVDWQGKTYTYRVTETKVVAPTDTSVLVQTAEPTVTLITCTPVFTSKERLVIHAVRI
jgi:sortase A